MEDIKPTRVNYISGRQTGWLTRHGSPTHCGELGCRQRGGVSGRDRNKRGYTLFEEEPKVTVPNKVTTLICWRLDVERVFNQSV